jgi:hypothetical protein
MSGAEDAGVIVPHRLFAFPGDLVGRLAGQLRDELPGVFFDTLLVLRGRWHNLGVTNQALIVKTVAVVKRSSRYLGSGGSNAGVDGYIGPCLGWALIYQGIDDAQSFPAGKHHLDSPHEMLLKGLRTGTVSARSRAASAGST